jgi:excisionase family DNA binding protein
VTDTTIILTDRQLALLADRVAQHVLTAIAAPRLVDAATLSQEFGTARARFGRHVRFGAGDADNSKHASRFGGTEPASTGRPATDLTASLLGAHAGTGVSERLANPTDRTPSLLTAEEVAEMLGVATSWIYEQSRTGRIPTVKLGRYYRYRFEAIERWIASQEVGP